MENVQNELPESEKDPDYFFELHYGHRCFESDDSYASDESGSFDENLQPPFDTVEEIDRNVIIEPGNLKSICGSSSEIAKLLAKCITPTYCFICKKQGGKHYTASWHYIKVKKWLQSKLESVMKEPNLTDFFCEICNKALSDDNLAQTHYESVSHNNNSVNFCLPCLRPIPKKNMASHLKSKKHRLDSQNITKSISRIKEKSLLNMRKNITNNVHDLDTSLLKTEIKNEVVKDLTFYMKGKTGTEYVALANYIMDALGCSFCYICDYKVIGTHYNLQEHHKALEQWILGYVKMNGINLRHMDDLICFVCHAVFPNTEYAKIHYNSSNHESKTSQFCNVCLKKILGKSFINHYETQEHKIEEIKKQNTYESLENNSHIKNVLSALKKQQTRLNLDIHGVDIKIIKALIEDNMDIKAQCEPLIVSLLELMTPTYCFICNNSAFKNNQGLFKHYLYMGHRTKLQLLFHSNGNSLGLQKYESLYCETCNELFLNFKLAEQHYPTFRHKWNYNLYQKYNSNLCLYQKEFKTNRTTLNDIIKGHSILDAQNEVASSIDKVQSSESEINHRSTWVQQLAYLITLDECKICSVILDEEVANFHYSLESHNLQLRKWISCYERDNDSYVFEENQQMFNCCFCDNRFISDQLLNSHTSSHFSPLKGAKSYISHKKLTSNMSNDGQHSSLDNTDVDKVVQKETDKKDKDYDNWNSENESKTSSALQDDICGKPDWETIANRETLESFDMRESDNKPFFTLDERRDQKNEINKCADKWESDSSSEGTTDRVFKNLSLSEEIRSEMTKLINEVYFLRTVPQEESLKSLKELNQKLRDARDEYKTVEIRDADMNLDAIDNPFISPKTINRKFLNNLNTFGNDYNDSDYAKFKLSMEIHRLKMVVSNEMKIPSDIALSYIHNLHETLKGLIAGRYDIFDVNHIFDSNKTSSLFLAESIKLENELEQLDEILLKAQDTNVQVTLNIITQFNVQLETMLEYQKSSSKIDD